MSLTITHPQTQTLNWFHWYSSGLLDRHTVSVYFALAYFLSLFVHGSCSSWPGLLALGAELCGNAVHVTATRGSQTATSENTHIFVMRMITKKSWNNAAQHFPTQEFTKHQDQLRHFKLHTWSDLILQIPQGPKFEFVFVMSPQPLDSQIVLKAQGLVATKISSTEDQYNTSCCFCHSKMGDY